MKNSPTLLVLFAFTIFILGCTGPKPAPPPVEPVEMQPEDLIDPISVTGDAVGQMTAQGKLMAKRGALLDAYRNLLEQIKGLQIDSTTRVRDFVTTSDQIRTRCGGYIEDIGAVDYVDNGDGSWTAEIDLTADQVRKMLGILAEYR